MPRLLLLPAAALAAALLAAAHPKDEPARDKDKGNEKPKAGLKVGDELPGPFAPYNVTGKRRGKFHCLVCEQGLNPVVMVVVRGTDFNKDTPVGKLLAGLDQAVKKHERQRLAAFAVFLDDDLKDVVTEDDKREMLAKRLEEDLPGLTRLVLTLASKDVLEKYPLDPEAEVTVVLYDHLKVVAHHAFPKGGLKDEKQAQALVDEAVKKLTGKK